VAIRVVARKDFLMPASTDNKAPLAPIDPVKRARQIRDAIARRKIKRTDITDQILDIADQIVALEEQKTA
jgi:hypothetical protein